MKKKSSQTTTSAWQKTALVPLGLILSLVLLEAGMRFGGFVLLSIQEYGNLRSIRQKGAYRILCLGESTTQGKYPYLLERILNQRNIGVRFGVIDRGIAGTNTSAILRGVDSYLADYHPDMVVAMMGINDGGKHMPMEMLMTSDGMPFIRSMRTYKLARLLWLHILTKAEKMGLYKPADKLDSAKTQTSLLGTRSKETSDEAISADAVLKKAAIINPENDKDEYFERGVLFLNQDKFSQAEVLFNKAIEINPKNDNAYLGLGWVFQHQMETARSEYFFKKAIELNPENGTACLGLGWLYKVQGQLSQAEASFEKAVEYDPELNEPYFALGGVYRLQGKFSQAENLFKKGIEINPQNDSMLGAMASLYEEMGRPELAKEYLEKLNRLRLGHYASITVHSYRKLKEILDRNGIKLVCVQHPMRNVELLKRVFEKEEGIIFVDNERIFKKAMKKSSYKEYFSDMFAGDFGHCTQKGNKLLAQNIADVILKEVFNR